MRHHRNSKGSRARRHSLGAGGAEHGSTPELTRNGKRTGDGSPDALKLLLAQLRELGEYFTYYIAARTDSVKLTLKGVAVWTVLGAIGFVALAGLIVASIWCLLSGLSGGLGELFGGRPWAGNLAAGLFTLVGLALAAYYGLAKRQRASRERTVQKYEERQAKQRAEFGRSVVDQAAEAAAKHE